MPASLTIALGTTLLVMWLTRRLGCGWSAPMIVYCLAWTAAIGLYEARLFPFHDLSAYTWVAIALAWVSFVGAAFGGLHLARRRRGAASGSSTDTAAGLVQAMRVLLALGVVGTAVFAWRVHAALGLDSLWTQPKLVHNALTSRDISSSHLFLYYLGVAGTMLFGYLAISLRAQLRAVDALLLVLVVVGMMNSTERNHVLWVMTCWLFLAAAPPADARLWRLVGAGLLIGLLGGGFYLLGGEWLGKSPRNLWGALIIEARLADPSTDAATRARLQLPGYRPDPALDLPADARLHGLLPGGRFYRVSALYMAVAAALPALDQGLQHHARTFGHLTFRPVSRALVRLGLVPDALSGTTYEDARTPYPANAYTYLYEHARDFGLAGAVTFPALFGLLAGWAYQRVSRAPRSYWAVGLATLQGMTLWSPFQNRFVLTVSAYLVVALIAAWGLARWPPSRRLLTGPWRPAPVERPSDPSRAPSEPESAEPR